MQVDDVRDSFLSYMEENNHTIIPSSPLIPKGDSTTLFIGSGMQPIISNLLGEPHPQGKRLSNVQRCFRAGDMEEVGDNRHTTFFEMIGTWSLGDYFKKEAIPLIASFYIKVLGIDINNIFVTVFSGDPENSLPKDEESIEIWKAIFKEHGIDAKVREWDDSNPTKLEKDERIILYNEKNWWSRFGGPDKMPEGEPGGPDTELFFCFDTNNLKEGVHPNGNDSVFLEIGNIVFMEYKKEKKGFKGLPKRNVDFGGGLERVSAVIKGEDDIFLLDIFDSMRDVIGSDNYKKHPESSRIILDHLRSSYELFKDGVLPSNKDQGYLLRKLIRRAQYHTGLLTDKVSLQELVKAFKKDSADFIEMIDKEIMQFSSTLEKGINRIHRYIEEGKLDNENVFQLVTTHGVPIDLVVDIALEKGHNVDIEGFESLKEEHQSKSRRGKQFK